jgi:hypothetical protein
MRSQKSRRDFLKNIGLFGAATAAGAGAIYSGYKYEQNKGSSEMVRVLTEDNRLVMIPREPDTSGHSGSGCPSETWSRRFGRTPVGDGDRSGQMPQRPKMR